LSFNQGVVLKIRVQSWDAEGEGGIGDTASSRLDLMPQKCEIEPRWGVRVVK